MIKKMYLAVTFVFILFLIPACAVKDFAGEREDIEITPVAAENNDEMSEEESNDEMSEEESSPAEPEHMWINLGNGLVAHAGGSIDGIAGTNTSEAIIENYKLGHRVFEMDFNLTTDGRLVCVHDWPSYSGPLSVEDFLKIKIADRFAATELKDVFELMMVHKDMYIVTDTKSFDYTEEEIAQQFRQFYQLAEELDISLLDRVIPQIYDQKTYEILKKVYPFKSVIYTLYASPDNDDEVIDFVKDKDDIAVITMGAVRYSKNFYNELSYYNKHIYFFTLNSLEEIAAAKDKGVHGFYTDFVMPEDMETGFGEIKESINETMLRL